MRLQWTIMIAATLLGGCIAKTVVDVAALPVRAGASAGGKVIDWTTTSQAEADRNYGRKMRKAEEREGRERQEWAKRCRKTPDAAECRTYTGYRAGQD